MRMNHDHQTRSKRAITIAFWIAAVLVTAFAWAGLSLKALIERIGF